MLLFLLLTGPQRPLGKEVGMHCTRQQQWSLGKVVGGPYIRAQRLLGEAVEKLLLWHKGLWMKQLVGSAPAWRGGLS